MVSLIFAFVKMRNVNFRVILKKKIIFKTFLKNISAFLLTTDNIFIIIIERLNGAQLKMYGEMAELA